MRYLIRIRRDLAQVWTANDPVLSIGEPGYEIDTRRMKIGDGVTSWNELPYFSTGAQEGALLADHVASETPHPVYDDGPSLTLLYENAKV